MTSGTKASLLGEAITLRSWPWHRSSKDLLVDAVILPSVSLFLFRFVESRKVLGASQDLDLRSSDLIASVWDAFPRRYLLRLAETDPVRGKHPHDGARPGGRVVVFR